MKFGKKTAVLCGAAMSAGAGTVASAAPITAGDLVVYRVGDGTASLANTGNAVFLDEYTRTGTLVQSIAAPTVAAGANLPLIASGTATSEGMLTLSPDGQTVAFTGYGAALGSQTTSVVATASTVVPRVVGLLNVGTGAVNTTTGLTDAYSANNPRSAVVIGNTIYTAGVAAAGNSSGGVRSTTIGATTSTPLTIGGTTMNSSGGAQTTAVNTRVVNQFGGQLYFTSGSSPNAGLNAIGTGTSTAAGQNATNVLASGTSPYQFVLLDLSATVPGPDTLYVADDAANAIQKFTLGTGGTFTASGTIAATGVRGLTGLIDPTTGSVDLFGTTSTAIYSAVDASGFGNAATGTATTLVTAVANENFRGVAVTAAATTTVPEPTAIGMVIVTAAGVLGRRRQRA